MIEQLWRIKCDLCGRIEENTGYNTWKLAVPVLVENEWGGHKVESKELDLCPECRDAVTLLSVKEQNGGIQGPLLFRKERG